MAGGRQTFTILVIFIAVLLAYHQRNNAAVSTAQQAAESAADILSSATAQSTSTSSTVFSPNPAPSSPISTSPPVPRKPNTLLIKILSGLPSPFPYLYRFLTYQAYLLYTFVLFLYPILLLPLRLLWDFVLLILDPIILILSTAFHYFVALPVGILLSIGHALYPVYVFAASAIFLGGLMGACGGWIHSSLINPWIGATKSEIRTELQTEFAKADTDHYNYRRVDGYGYKGGRLDRKGKRVPRPTGVEEYDLDDLDNLDELDTRGRLSPERENLLRGWREEVWYVS